MDMSRLILREMKDGEQKALQKLGQKSFPLLEGWFVGMPKAAMVAEYEGNAIGCMMYKFVLAGKKKIAYIDQAFVDPAFHGMGVARRLYTETFQHIWEQGCDGITALVKDDNVGSWKPCMNNGFRRVSVPEAVKQLGFGGLLRLCLVTPLALGVGMDFDLVMKDVPLQNKQGGIRQALAFFLVNLLFAAPLWIRLAVMSPERLVPSLLAFLTVLALLLLPRLLMAVCRREAWRFRFNNCGGLIPFILSLMGNVFPMNANWYPDVYENSSAFLKRMAIPELIKWALFLPLPLLALLPGLYWRALSQISSYILLFSVLPLYPFEAFGAGRVFRYSKVLWAITAALTLLALIFLY